jgi:CDGSH-type Zn-finger protein
MNDVTIICRDNGPLRIAGKFVIQDAKGNTFDLSGRETISLCRCGASTTKPFCDGAHRQAGFESAVQATRLPPPTPIAGA